MALLADPFGFSLIIAAGDCIRYPKIGIFPPWIGRDEDPAGEIHRSTTVQTDSANITCWLRSVRGCWSSSGEQVPNVFFPRYKEVTIGKNKSGTFLLSRALNYFAVALLLIAALPLPAADDVEYDPDRIEFVFGNVVFVTLHEIAHIVIEDFDVPVLGNNEDAADSLAAVQLIRLDRARPEQDLRLILMLLTTADANRILWQCGLETNNPVMYLTRHPLSVQRAARNYCLVSGRALATPDPRINNPAITHRGTVCVRTNGYNFPENFMAKNHSGATDRQRFPVTKVKK